jgi:chromate reductase
MPCLQQEAYIGYVAKLFDANGTLVNEDTKAFFTKIMQAFGAWIDTNAA